MRTNTQLSQTDAPLAATGYDAIDIMKLIGSLMVVFIWTPFRSLRSNIYANVRILGKLRVMIKRS